MKKRLSIFVRQLLGLGALTLLGGLLCATLVRFSPGYGVDERELDPRLNQQSIEAIRKERAANSSLLHFYWSYLGRASRGDLGVSESFQQPVASLIRDRFPVTARSVFSAMVTAWAFAFALAAASLSSRWRIFAWSGTAASVLLLALPSAAIAVLCVYLRAPVFVAIAAVTFPRLFRYTRNLLADAVAQPHVLAARARGVDGVRLFWRHVFPPAAPGIVALLGVSVSIAFGAAVPIEALCDSAGVGQLAWNAALNRDLPLITSLTLIVTIVTVACNSLAASGANLFQRAE